MSLSDKDLELASKYIFTKSDFKDWLSGKKENVHVMMFTHEALEAFLAERDALAIKEQALVAAAYRVAADAICPSERAKWSKRLQPVADANRAVCEVNRDVILNLSASDAEAKLRELMVKAALSVASSAYTDAEVKQIVDGMLAKT